MGHGEAFYAKVQTFKIHYYGYFVEYIWRKKYATTISSIFYALVEHIFKYHHIYGGIVKICTSL